MGLAECLGAEGASESEEEAKDMQAEQQEIEEMIEEMGKHIEVYTSDFTDPKDEDLPPMLDDMVKAVKQSVGTGIWDTGCRRTLAGSRWIRNYVTALAKLQYTAEWTATEDKSNSATKAS